MADTTTAKDLRAEPLTDADRKLIGKLFSNPLVIPVDFKQWLVAWLEANPPNLPIEQSLGFDNLVQAAIDNANTAAANAQSAADAANAQIFHPSFGSNEGEVHFTGTSYATISGGPSITGLDNGHYVVLFGAAIFANNGDEVHMAVMPNSDSGSISASLEVQGLVITEHDGFTASVAGGHVSTARGVGLITMSAGDGSNRFDAVYKTQLGHDCDQREGWIIALKVANL